MSYVTELCERAKTASFSLATLTSGKKDAALSRIADEILRREKEILSENDKDLAEAKKTGLASALVDRLTLTPKRVAQMAQAVREIRDFPDPVGEVVYSTRRPDGLQIYQERVPIGVLCVIFESRPNVVIDIAALALKSGNAAILRGGKEAFHSNQILGRIVSDSVAGAGLPVDSVQVIDKTDRSLMEELLKQKNHIDIVVPRGGENLIRYVSETSLIPVVKHDKGLCHTFVDASADADMAVKVAVNAKVQRPGTCNATECLLIHKDYPGKQALIEAFVSAGVQLRGDEAIQKISSKVKKATPEDYDTEYLDLILSVREVASYEEAVAWIRRHGSGHSEAIITSDYSRAIAFQNEVDAACVFVNASTRLSDGGCFGLGAEVGISTQKLHVRGPMGVRDLTCLKYKIFGTGQLRE